MSNVTDCIIDQDNIASFGDDDDSMLAANAFLMAEYSEQTHPCGDLSHDGAITRADSGVVKVITYQGVNPGINGDFTVAEIAFEALGVGEGTLDLEIVTLTDSTPLVNHLDHPISNGTVTICQTYKRRMRSAI